MSVFYFFYLQPQVLITNRNCADIICIYNIVYYHNADVYIDDIWSFHSFGPTTNARTEILFFPFRNTRARKQKSRRRERRENHYRSLTNADTAGLFDVRARAFVAKTEQTRRYAEMNGERVVHEAGHFSPSVEKSQRRMNTKKRNYIMYYYSGVRVVVRIVEGGNQIRVRSGPVSKWDFLHTWNNPGSGIFRLDVGTPRTLMMYDETTRFCCFSDTVKM